MDQDDDPKDTKDNPWKQIGRAKVLLAEAFKIHQRLGEQLDQVHRALEKHPTKGQYASRLLQFFAANWEKKYAPQKLAIANPEKEIGIWLRLMKAVPPAELCERVRRYFKQTDEFIVSARHPFGLFVSRINDLSIEASAPPIPIGCKHQPACRDDAVHTRRVLTEQRNRA